jgi:hypothetical protein
MTIFSFELSLPQNCMTVGGIRSSPAMVDGGSLLLRARA